MMQYITNLTKRWIWAETAFVMQNFRNLGGGGEIFWRNPKRHILGWCHVFWAIDRANPFTSFFSRRAHEKREQYKKSQRGYISPISTKIGVSVGVDDVINRTKFGNDLFREYKVTEGRILACSIGMACRLHVRCAASAWPLAGGLCACAFCNFRSDENQMIRGTDGSCTLVYYARVGSAS